MSNKKKEVGAIIVLIIIMVIIASVYGNLFSVLKTGNIFATGKTTISHKTNSTAKTNSTSKNQSTISYAGSCSDIYIYLETGINNTTSYRCGWTGGKLGIWLASGAANNVTVDIKGANNLTYINQTSDYQCLTFLRYLNLSAQNYTVTFETHGASGKCVDPYEQLIINSTTSPPTNMSYDFVYNGNFSYGTYAGWDVNTTAFGSNPSNIIELNQEYCFKYYQWSGLVGNYFATTASCSHQPKSGNLTSSYFNATYPYLDFQIVQPSNSTDEILVLYGNTTAITAKYNTYSMASGNFVYYFENATIPLASVRDKFVRLEIASSVAALPKEINYSERPLSSFIAIGDIHMSYTPWQYKNITKELLINGSG